MININGKPIILVGKMGSGKTSVANCLMTDFSNSFVRYVRIKTYTTRAKREEETEDSYHFVSNSVFDEMKENGEFAEYYETERIVPGFIKDTGKTVSVIQRVQYGSKKMDYQFDAGSETPKVVKIIILEPEGALKAVKTLGVRNCNVIYLKAKDEVLEAHCLLRGTEDEKEIERRLAEESEKFQGFEARTDLTINCNNMTVEDIAYLINRYVHNNLY